MFIEISAALVDVEMRPLTLESFRLMTETFRH